MHACKHGRGRIAVTFERGSSPLRSPGQRSYGQQGQRAQRGHQVRRGVPHIGPLVGDYDASLLPRHQHHGGKDDADHEKAAAKGGTAGEVARGGWGGLGFGGGHGGQNTCAWGGGEEVGVRIHVCVCGNVQMRPSKDGNPG
jgi:hypothetical protein